MTTDEAVFFKLLSEYARNRHRCFLAEMTLVATGAEYSLCFRPLTDSNRVYDCKYLKVVTEQVTRTAGEARLKDAVLQQIDGALEDFDRSRRLNCLFSV